MRAAHAGEALLDPAVAARLVEAIAEPAGEAPPRRPDRRASARCSTLIARGLLEQADRAASSAISEKTVKTHVGHVLAKLGVTDRTQAALLRGARRGCVDAEVLGPIAAGNRDRPAA